MKRLKNKGFTLVEVIAIVVILAAIFLVAFPIVLNTSKKAKTKEYNQMVDVLCDAGKSYIYTVSEQNNISEQGDKTTVYISDLIEQGVVDPETKNPKNDTLVSDDRLLFEANEDLSLSCTLQTLERIPVPTAENNCNSNLVYTGDEINLVKNPNSNVTYQNGKGTNAGNYTITAIIDAYSPVIWADRTTENKTFTCSIAKADDQITVTPTTRGYTGLSMEATVTTRSGLPTNNTYYSDNTCTTVATPLALGTYYVIATTAGNDNYNAANSGCQQALTISKAVLAANATCDASKIYDGTRNANCSIVLSNQNANYAATATCLYDNANVGINKVITCSNITATDDISNYTISEDNAVTTGDIYNATLAFNANPGTLSGTTPLYIRKGQSAVYTGLTNSTVGTIPVATRTGYTFDGWNSPSGIKIINADRTLVSNISGWVNSNGTWLLTTNQTLTAAWVDRTAPTIIATHTGSAIGGTITDAGSGVVAYAITPTTTTSLDEDSSEWISVGNSPVASFTIPSTAHTSGGRYVHAKDAAGNIIKTYIGVSSLALKANETRTINVTSSLTNSTCETTNSNIATCTLTPKDGGYTLAITSKSTDGDTVVKIKYSNGSVMNAYNVTVDTVTPTPIITGGATPKVSTQTVTLKCSDNKEVAAYYWGTTNPTSADSITTTTSLSSLTGNGLNTNITASGTYYLACKDAVGNFDKTSIVIRKYQVQNVLITTSGTAGTYTSANYAASGSTSTYYIKNGTVVTPADIYTTTAATGTFLGYTTAAPSETAQTPSKASITISDNTTKYYMWFNRTTFTVTLNAGTYGSLKGERVNLAGSATASAGGSNTITVRYGEKIKATATPVTGYAFNGFSGGYLSGTTNPQTGDAITEDKTITANWKDTNPPTLTLSKQGEVNGFDGWELASTTTLDSNQILTLNSTGTPATSPYYQVDEQNYGWSYEFYPTATATYFGSRGGANTGTIYYNSGFTRQVGENSYDANGQAIGGTVNTWTSGYRANYNYGENIEYLKLNLNANSTYSTPPTKYRNFKVYGDIYAKSKYTINVTASDAEGSVATTKYASGSQSVDYFASNGTVFTGNSFDVTSNGTYTVYAVDNVGNGTVKTITIDKIDNTAPTISSFVGKMLNTDPTFASDVNGANVYNNEQNGTVTINRIANSDWPRGSGYVLQIKTAGTARPGLGGFVQYTNSYANGEFYHVIVAKIPVGYSIQHAQNQTGDGREITWLTSQNGTGKYETYIYKHKCGSSGTFSNFGHVYIDGTAATSSKPVTWYVAYASMFDATKLDATTNYIVSYATDADAGVTSYKMTTSNTKPTSWDVTTTARTVANIQPITSNGTYYAWFMDTAGNIASKSITTNVKPVKIYYHPNGGTVGSSSYTTCNNGWVCTNSTTYFVQTKDFGASGDLYNTTTFGITRTGYGIPDGTEWCTQENGGGTCFDHDVSYTYAAYKAAAQKDLTANYELDLYTHWAANTYTVALNANGGSGGTSSVNITYGTTQGNYPSITRPTRTGYTFNGFWDTDAASGGTQWYNASGNSLRTFNIASNTTWYARWTPNVYNVTLNNQSATSAGTGTIYEKFATGYYLNNSSGTVSNLMSTSANPITKPTKTNYSFRGYWTGTADTSDKYVSDSGYLTAAASTTNFTAAGTLYAHWEKNNYQVGSSYYSTLANAYDACTSSFNNGATCTITVIDSNTDSSSITVAAGTSVIINTNGKTITKTTSSIVNRGTLSITGSGKITASAVHTINNAGGGSLTINGPTIESTASATYYTVYNDSSYLTLTSGTISSTSIGATYSGYVTINGGTISLTNNNTVTAYAVNTSGSVTMTGGTITVTRTNSSTTNASSYSSAAINKTGTYGALTITGGTVNLSCNLTNTTGNVGNECYAIRLGSDMNNSISGLTLTSTHSGSSPSYGLYNMSGSKVVLGNGNNFTTKGIAVLAYGTTTFNSVTSSTYNSNTSYGIWARTASSTTVIGSGNNITGTTAIGMGSDITTSGSMTINGGTITGTSTYAVSNSSAASLTITDGTLTSPNFVVYNSSSGVLTFGKNDNEISTEYPYLHRTANGSSNETSTAIYNKNGGTDNTTYIYDGVYEIARFIVGVPETVGYAAIYSPKVVIPGSTSQASSNTVNQLFSHGTNCNNVGQCPTSRSYIKPRGGTPTLSVSIADSSTYTKTKSAKIIIAGGGTRNLKAGTYTIKYTVVASDASAPACSSMSNTATITVSGTTTQTASTSVTVGSGLTGSKKIYVCNSTAIQDTSTSLAANSVRSASFNVDNTPPTITFTQSGTQVTGTGTTKTSGYIAGNFKITATCTDNHSRPDELYNSAASSEKTTNASNATSITLAHTFTDYSSAASFSANCKDKAGNVPSSASTSGSYVVYRKFQLTLTDNTFSGVEMVVTQDDTLNGQKFFNTTTDIWGAPFSISSSAQYLLADNTASGGGKPILVPSLAKRFGIEGRTFVHGWSVNSHATTGGGFSGNLVNIYYGSGTHTSTKIYASSNYAATRTLYAITSDLLFPVCVDNYCGTYLNPGSNPPNNSTVGTPVSSNNNQELEYHNGREIRAYNKRNDAWVDVSGLCHYTRYPDGASLYKNGTKICYNISGSSTSPRIYCDISGLIDPGGTYTCGAK